MRTMLILFMLKGLEQQKIINYLNLNTYLQKVHNEEVLILIVVFIIISKP